MLLTLTELPPVSAADGQGHAGLHGTMQRGRRAVLPSAKSHSHLASPEARQSEGSASPQQLPPGMAPSCSPERQAIGTAQRAASLAQLVPGAGTVGDTAAQPAPNLAAGVLDRFAGLDRSYENIGWDAKQWREEQEALFEAEMAMQSQQMLSIIGTEWASQGAARAQAVDETMVELRAVESKLSKVHAVNVYNFCRTFTAPILLLMLRVAVSPGARLID